MAKKPDSSRVPSAVGAIPVVGDLVKSADTQARWMQEVLEQNARLVSQFPATMKTFNDALERFNQTVGRLDRAVTQIETVSKNLTGPVERLAAAVDPKVLRDIPETLDQLRREAVPALRAATDTQRQVALLQSTVERVVSVLSEMPGAGVLRRLAGSGGGRDRAAGGEKQSDSTSSSAPARSSDSATSSGSAKSGGTTSAGRGGAAGRSSKRASASSASRQDRPRPPA